MKSRLGAFLAVLSLLLSCGGGTEVGSGKDLSLFDTPPTGVELARAVLEGAVSAGFNQTFDAGTNSPDFNVYESACGGEGTARSESRYVDGGLSNSSDSLRVRTCFQGCRSSLLVGNTILTEKITGTFEMSAEGDSGRIRTSLSLSGTLGLAVDCAIDASRDPATRADMYTGGCAFRDAKGTVLTMPGNRYPEVIGFGD
jgi:hypothetical protein